MLSQKKPRMDISSTRQHAMDFTVNTQGLLWWETILQEVAGSVRLRG